MSPVRVVPDVNALLAQPEQVNTLDPAMARTFVIQLAALMVLLSSRASEPSPAPVPDPTLWLSVEQVTQQFGLDRAWIAEHRRLLSSLGITSRVSRKTVLFDRRKLTRFVESKRHTNSSGDLA